MAGQGVLALWLDVAEEQQTPCDEWYVREHIPDRIRLPGFRHARRFEALAATPRTVAIYETDRIERMLEPGYLGLVQRISDESRTIRAAFRGVVRGAFRVTAQAGFGQGAVVATWRFAPAPAQAAALRDWLCRTIVPGMVTQHCLVAAQLWEADAAVRERMDAVRATGSTDGTAEWVLLLEGTRQQDVQSAIDTLLPPGTLQRHGARPGDLCGFYTLLYAAHTPA